MDEQQQQQQQQPAGRHEQAPDEPAAHINGLLVSYKDDQLDDCVAQALGRKSRVRFKCMDSLAGLLALGTNAGAVYLFQLEPVTHSRCKLDQVLNCGQGSVEALRLLAQPQADELLLALGTARGSLLLFRLAEPVAGAGLRALELLRAESFTPHAIKLLEFERDLLEPQAQPARLFICDAANRLFVLETAGLGQALRLFYAGPSSLPSLVFSVDDSNINQISAHRSQLLISTDETTRVFDLASGQLSTIGKKKRRRGFYGACFFSPAYKPARVLQQQQPAAAQARLEPPSRAPSQQTLYSSSNSLGEPDNVLAFVARPSFRLWQVSSKREVMFTHQFEAALAAARPSAVFELQGAAAAALDEREQLESVERAFGPRHQQQQQPPPPPPARGADHFRRLVHIYSATLGNLLLSHTEHQLFVLDPIGARLIAWHQQREPIAQVCCVDNELYIWSWLAGGAASAPDSQQQQQQQQQPAGACEGARAQVRLRRLVLLAPSQFVLELHRLQRHLALMSFVQMFAAQFRRCMSLPLAQSSEPVTVEGGLLRNILLSAWDSWRLAQRAQCHAPELVRRFGLIIEQIVQESRQLKQSLDNLSDSTFLLALTNENIERLCCEPYTSLVSLEVSIASLHTNRVIHFNQAALNRHKSMANLGASLNNLSRLKAQSSLQLNGPAGELARAADQQHHHQAEHTGQQRLEQLADERQVLVRRHKLPRDAANALAKQRALISLDEQAAAEPGAGMSIEQMSAMERRDQKPPAFFSTKSSLEARRNKLEQLERGGQQSALERCGADSVRCSNCRWPTPRSHLKPLHSSQQIQLDWIRDNLMPSFEQNLDEIQQLAFKHALWLLYMRCLIQRNHKQQFAYCCVMLNDVRLLTELDSLDDELIDQLLDLLAEKTIFLNELSPSAQASKGHCFKCRHELDSSPLEQAELDATHLAEPAHLSNDNSATTGHLDTEDEIAFNLINLFDQLTATRGVDIRKAVERLRRHATFLKNSRIPARFYLKVISAVTLSASQMSLVKNRKSYGLARLTRHQTSPVYT